MTCIMRPSLELSEVYIYRQAIDFRKSHRGLAAIVETLQVPHLSSISCK
jgi:transposase